MNSDITIQTEVAVNKIGPVSDLEPHMKGYVHIYRHEVTQI